RCPPVRGQAGSGEAEGRRAVPQTPGRLLGATVGTTPGRFSAFAWPEESGRRSRAAAKPESKLVPPIRPMPLASEPAPYGSPWSEPPRGDPVHPNSSVDAADPVRRDRLLVVLLLGLLRGPQCRVLTRALWLASTTGGVAAAVLRVVRADQHVHLARVQRLVLHQLGRHRQRVHHHLAELLLARRVLDHRGVLRRDVAGRSGLEAEAAELVHDP